MSTMKFLLIGIASVHACTDSYATPDHGGDYCSGFSAFSDGQNCWGDCVTGCPAIQPCSPGPCYMETRDISTQGSCTLACQHEALLRPCQQGRPRLARGSQHDPARQGTRQADRRGQVRGGCGYGRHQAAFQPSL